MQNTLIDNGWIIYSSFVDYCAPVLFSSSFSEGPFPQKGTSLTKSMVMRLVFEKETNESRGINQSLLTSHHISLKNRGHRKQSTAPLYPL